MIAFKLQQADLMQQFFVFLTLIGLLHGVSTMPAEETEFPKVIGKGKILLEFGREYTAAELEENWRRHLQNPDVPIYDGIKETPAGTEAVNSDGVQETAARRKGPARSPKVYESVYKYISYEAECAHHWVYGHFHVGATYDGSHVYFPYDKKSGIDKYVKQTVSGGYHHPIISNGAFKHSECMQVGLRFMCAYYHRPVVRATVEYPHHLLLQPVQPYDTDNLIPYVTEVCNFFKNPLEKMTCPPADPDKPHHCNIPAGVGTSDLP